MIVWLSWFITIIYYVRCVFVLKHFLKHHLIVVVIVYISQTVQLYSQLRQERDAAPATAM
jgi:hypothetical protein